MGSLAAYIIRYDSRLSSTLLRLSSLSSMRCNCASIAEIRRSSSSISLAMIKAEKLAIRDGPNDSSEQVGQVRERPEVQDALALPPEARQVVGKAGDLVLMHPLVVHCGSTNLSSRVRIMGNGMVRMKRSAFEQRGGMFFAPKT